MEKINRNKRRVLAFKRAVLEVGFIIFLFYSNLLMGEYTRSSLARGKGIIWALKDIFTLTNFIIAIVLASLGHLFFDFFKRKAQ